MAGTVNFLFINRTGKSSKLTSQRKIEAAQIQRHVQSGRRRPRKLKQGSKLNRKHSAGHSEIRDGLQKSVMSSRLHPNGSVEDTRALSPIPLTSRLLFRGSSDPFSVSVIPISETVQNLLQYYTTIYHPSCWPNEQAALKRGGYIFENAVNTTVRNTLHDEMLMYSVLVAAISRMKYIDALPTKYTDHIDEYMHKALQKVQQRINQQSLSKSDRSSMMSAMMFLSSAEAYRSDFNTRSAHRKAAKIHLEGALILLNHFEMDITGIEDPNLQGQIIMSDLFLACVNMERCLVDGGLFDPGPAIVLNLADCELFAMTNELNLVATDLMRNSCLSDELRDIVNDIKEVYTTKLRLNIAEMQPKRALETTHWISKRAMAIRNRLMIVFPFKSSTKPRIAGLDNTLELATRVALVQFTLISMNITGRVKTVKVMAKHLRGLLEPMLEADLELSSCRTKLLIWILATGLTCAQAVTSTEIWFKQNLEKIHEQYYGPSGLLVIQKFAHMQDYDGQEVVLQEVVSLLHKYFYHAPIQEDRLSALFRRGSTRPTLATSVKDPNMSV